MFTVALAGVAIFTAVRLYQQRGESVAPTAPTSIPRAADTTANTTSCSPVTFSLAGEPVCGDPCSADTDCPTDHTCSTTTNKCVLTACLAAGASCDANNCNEVTPVNPNCGDTCSTNTDCPTDHTCSGGKCVLTLCTQSGRTCTANNCSLAPKCGDTCTTNAQCPNDHTCTSGKCVLNSCLSGSTCTADKCSTTSTTAPTAAPTNAPKLPTAGTSYPTVIAGGLGILAIIGALFFAF